MLAATALGLVAFSASRKLLNDMVDSCRQSSQPASATKASDSATRSQRDLGERQ